MASRGFPWPSVASRGLPCFFYITIAIVVAVDDPNFQPAPSPRSGQVAARVTEEVLDQHESLALGGKVDRIPEVRDTTAC